MLVCKSAGNCPVKFVLRDVTEVKLLTFLLWVFVSNILPIISGSFSPAPHFHLHVFLGSSFLFSVRPGRGWHGRSASLGRRKQHQSALCLRAPRRTTLNFHRHFLLQITPMAYSLQPRSFLHSLRICWEINGIFSHWRKHVSSTQIMFFLSLPVAESLASQVLQTSSPDWFVTWKTWRWQSECCLCWQFYRWLFLQKTACKCS